MGYVMIRRSNIAGKKRMRLARWILWCALLLVWAWVTVYTFGFHHHHPDEHDCEKDSCPFLSITLNLPLLFVATYFPVMQRAIHKACTFSLVLAPIHFVSPLFTRGPPFLFSN
jgi:hypothetical protein